MDEQFYEKLIFEYPSIKKWKSWNKDTFYKIRIIEKRCNDGLIKRFLDIREFIVKNEYSGLTDSSVCLSKINLDILIDTLIKARKEYFDGSGDRSRSQNTRYTPKEKKLP